jgi:acetyl-CoA carboxylase biotin carboxyl carrier protein
VCCEDGVSAVLSKVKTVNLKEKKMDVKELKVLVKMITETDITEFEMENNEEKIVIRRGAKTEYVAMSPAAYAAPQPVAAPAAPQAAAPSAAPAAPVETGETITSPIVGTFYSAPSPDAPPYAQVGQVIEKGQQLCIVEAMKLMNEIDAEFRCRIIKACKENAQAVEYGDALFVVERL